MVGARLPKPRLWNPKTNGNERTLQETQARGKNRLNRLKRQVNSFRLYQGAQAEILQYSNQNE